MKTHIRKTCSDNLGELLSLSVSESQTHLIAPNAEWLAEAFHIDDSETFGIYTGETAIGLVSWIDPRLAGNDGQDKTCPPDDMLYIWRFMIDHFYQGKGHALEMVEIFKQAASLRGLSGIALTTMDERSHNALDFYIKAGFTPSGRRIDGEIELILRIE